MLSTYILHVVINTSIHMLSTYILHVVINTSTHMLSAYILHVVINTSIHMLSTYILHVVINTRQFFQPSSCPSPRHNIPESSWYVSNVPSVHHYIICWLWKKINVEGIYVVIIYRKLIPGIVTKTAQLWTGMSL